MTGSSVIPSPLETRFSCMYFDKKSVWVVSCWVFIKDSVLAQVSLCYGSAVVLLLKDLNWCCLLLKWLKTWRGLLISISGVKYSVYSPSFRCRIKHGLSLWASKTNNSQTGFACCLFQREFWNSEFNESFVFNYKKSCFLSLWYH